MKYEKKKKTNENKTHINKMFRYQKSFELF